MTTSQTANKSLYIITPGTETNTWGPYINNTTNYLDACLGAFTTINMNGRASYVLLPADLQASTIVFTGTLNSGVVPVQMPITASGQFTFINGTTPTDSTSTLSIGWAAGGNLITIPQNSTQILTGNAGSLTWYRSAPAFSGVSTAINYISLNGLSSYTLTSTDIQSQVIVFTGTLANLTVPVKLPDAYSGQWTIVNATTAAGTSSLLQMAWVTSTTTYTVNQSSAQVLYATNTLTPTWYASAPQAQPGTTTIDLTGLGSSYIVSDAQARNNVFILSGTPNTVTNSLLLLFPSTAVGLYVFCSTWVAGSTAVIVGWKNPPGGAAVQLTTGTNKLLLGSRDPQNASQNKWSTLTL